MAIRLFENMRFSDLSRSSAIAGMLMFTGASLLVVIWALLFPGTNHSQLNQAALLILIAILVVLGVLRGILDAWLYQRMRNRRHSKP